MTFSTTVARTAKINRRCGSCSARIEPGVRYLVHTCAPGGDLGFAGWERYGECPDCAARYGRADMLTQPPQRVVG